MRGVALLALLFALPARAERAVSVYGEVFEGAIRVDKNEVVIVDGEDETRRPAHRFLLVEKDDGTPVWSRGVAARLRAYASLARRQRRDLLAGLLKTALLSRNAAIARRAFEQAEADGFMGKEADRVKKKVEALEKRRPTKTYPDRVAAVERGLEKAARLHADLLVERAVKDAEHGLVLVREALAVTPDHPPALALLAARAPPEVVEKDRRFWLDFQVDLAAGGARLGTEDARFFDRIRHQWRKDLYGVAAGPIRLFTPVKETGAIGRCLAYGQLTCRALTEIFATDAPKPRVAKWMVVFMYGDKDEYLKTTGVGRRVENPAFLKWSLGYFSPQDQISRVFWHTDPDAERRIARTFVHELTHHWLMELNPCYANHQVRRNPTLPGYWVVEGFATFMEEGVYDIESMTWDMFDARAKSIDVVHAVAGQRKLIPWKRLYAMHQILAQSLSPEPAVAFVRRWSMGERRMAPVRLFYEQAAATCQFLYHGAGGRYRARLVDYVVAQYTGDRDRLAIPAAFGVTPEELGAAVERFAAEVAQGWRPDAK